MDVKLLEKLRPDEKIKLEDSEKIIDVLRQLNRLKILTNFGLRDAVLNLLDKTNTNSKEK